jgi:ParB family chromosome partitioning protein
MTNQQKKGGANKGLGRGLSALIPEGDMNFLSRVARGEGIAVPLVAGVKDETVSDVPQTGDAEDDTRAAPTGIPDSVHATVGKNAVQWLEISKIEPNPYQPRRTFAAQELEELSTSIREHGLLQPILVRPDDKELSFQLIAGERRWRAAQLAGLMTIPAIVRAVADQQALELALIENVQRHDISPLDAALAYRRLAQEFSLSQEAVAQRVGKSRVAVANTMRLLELPAEAQKAIEDGALSEGHGRAILLASGEGARRAVLRGALREQLSVRATEELARRTLRHGDDEVSPKAPGVRKSDVALRALEERLQAQLKTRVKLKPRSKGGQIIIEYFSPEELERVIGLLMRTP